MNEVGPNRHDIFEKGAVEPDGEDAKNAVERDGEAPGAAELAQCRKKVTELDDRWRRAAADLDNLRKRVARDAGQARADERARVAAEWLPMVDNLELALEHADADPEKIVEGIRAVRDQALAILARLGFPRRDELGERFDPARHEAVSAIPGTAAPAGTVIHVVRPGYGDAERQLRPAAVVVATGEPTGPQ